jgi:hypothetical protein
VRTISVHGVPGLTPHSAPRSHPDRTKYKKMLHENNFFEQ